MAETALKEGRVEAACPAYVAVRQVGGDSSSVAAPCGVVDGLRV